VVKAVPDNGAADVDPAVREVRVVFDQPMDTSMFSFVGGGESFPKTRGQPFWADDRTCVLPVALEPDHDYWLSVNSDRFTNFRNMSGEPAAPYPIAFKTGAARPAGPPRPQAEVNREAVAALRRAVDMDYAYRDRAGVDWPAAFSRAAPLLEGAKTAADFAEAAGKMLAAARDYHVWLEADGKVFASARRDVAPNSNPAVLAKQLPGWRQHNATVASARLPDGATYLAINSWDAGRAKDLEAAFDVLRAADPAKGLIVDVRTNSGGSETLAATFAGCFVEKPVVYSRNLNRAGGRFGGPYDRTLQPNADGPAYRGRVAVLMGPVNMSACESFLLMMRQAPGCRLAGERSCGSSGNPRPHDLGNGVTVYLSSWQDQTPDGRPVEGVGVEPDVTVKAAPADLARGDPVLKAALAAMRNAPR
jgi:hypothetical protein